MHDKNRKVVFKEHSVKQKTREFCFQDDVEFCQVWQDIIKRDMSSGNTAKRNSCLRKTERENEYKERKKNYPSDGAK
mgnify:CR=1 FL=1